MTALTKEPVDMKSYESHRHPIVSVAAFAPPWLLPTPHHCEQRKNKDTTGLGTISIQFARLHRERFARKESSGRPSSTLPREMVLQPNDDVKCRRERW